MKPQKLPELIKLYQEYLEEIGLRPQELSEIQYHQVVDEKTLLEHCSWMIGQLKPLLAEGAQSVDQELIWKALTWMGFVQGCLAANGHRTVGELRNESRS